MDVHRNVKYEARILAKEIMKSKLNRLNIVTVCGTALLIAATVAIVVVSRNRCRQLPPIEVLVAMPPAEVRVKAVERKPDLVERDEISTASDTVAIICGRVKATADRYEERNNALRSIARRRDLPKEDVASLMVYLQSTEDALRSERVAALKNDVMNLLRSQEPSPE